MSKQNNVNVKRSIIRIILLTACILLVPLVAMQFSDEVNWSPGDFIIAGALLVGTGLIFEFVVRKITNPRRRLIIGSILVLAFLLIWADLAVGIFGLPWSGS
ncbi:hypothetical protein D3C86_1375320 [compost metagenome]